MSQLSTILLTHPRRKLMKTVAVLIMVVWWTRLMPRASSFPLTTFFVTRQRPAVFTHNPSFCTRLWLSTQCDLSRTAIRRMRVAQLREELMNRGLDSSGIREVLLGRLLEAVHGGDKPGETKVQFSPNGLYVLRFRGHTNTSYSNVGIGLALYNVKTNKEVWSAYKYFFEENTRFEAEYKGIALGLKYAYDHGVRRIVLQGDNAVIMSQLQGDFKVKKENLKKLYWSTVHLKEQFDQFEVQTITSTENSRAKSLASRAVATKKTQGFEGMDLKGDKHHQSVNGTPSLTSQAPPKAQSIDDGMHTLSPIIPSKQYLLRFDGGSRGNPGISGSGMVIYDDHQQEVWCGWKFLDGRSTNNEAEYTALLVGLQCALFLGIRKLRVQGDSELIVRQLEGRYQVKDERLKELYNKTKALVTRFDEIEIRHIPRAMNKRADELANQAMDSRESFGFHVIDA